MSTIEYCGRCGSIYESVVIQKKEYCSVCFDRQWLISRRNNPNDYRDYLTTDGAIEVLDAQNARAEGV